MKKPAISQGERGLEIHSLLGKYSNGSINSILVSFIKEEFDTRREERMASSLGTKLILEVRQERRTKLQREGRQTIKHFFIWQSDLGSVLSSTNVYRAWNFYLLDLIFEDVFKICAFSLARYVYLIVTCRHLAKSRCWSQRATWEIRGWIGDILGVGGGTPKRLQGPSKKSTWFAKGPHYLIRNLRLLPRAWLSIWPEPVSSPPI